MRISDWSSDVCSSDLVRANWPGATAREVEQQVTDKIEKKLQATPFLNYVMSYSKPAESTVYVVLRDDTPPKQVRDIWYQVRKKVSDIRQTLPQGTQGPFFNDEFGDTFGTTRQEEHTSEIQSLLRISYD